MKPLRILLFRSLLLSIILFGVISCKKNKPSPSFTGENQIVLTPENATITNDGEDSFEVSIQLVSALSKSIVLEFELLENKLGDDNLLLLEPSKVTIDAGMKVAKLKVKSKIKGGLTTPREVILQMVSNPNVPKLKAPLKISVKPTKTVEALTEAQINLLKGYKEKGLDLFPLIGEIEVEANVSFPGGVNLEALNNSYNRVITGKTIITLSEKATTDKPILKMMSNPMGIEDYLYKEIFRKVTVEDVEYWTNSPSSQKVMQLINLSANSKEEFGMSLDNIEIKLNPNPNTENVTFGTQKVKFDEPYSAVGFTYNYTAWNRLKAKIDEANAEAIEAYETGGTINPSEILDNEDITKDEYKLDASSNQPSINWKPSKASLDATNRTLLFEFPMGHKDMDDYVFFTIKYRY